MLWSQYGLVAKFFEPQTFESCKQSFSFCYRNEMKRILSKDSRHAKEARKGQLRPEPLPFQQTEHANLQKQSERHRIEKANAGAHKPAQSAREVKQESLQFASPLFVMNEANSRDSDDGTEEVFDEVVKAEATTENEMSSEHVSALEAENEAHTRAEDTIEKAKADTTVRAERPSKVDEETRAAIDLFDEQIVNSNLKDSAPVAGQTVACRMHETYFKVRILRVNSREQEMTVELLDLNIERTISVRKVKRFLETPNLGRKEKTHKSFETEERANIQRAIWDFNKRGNVDEYEVNGDEPFLYEEKVSNRDEQRCDEWSVPLRSIDVSTEIDEASNVKNARKIAGRKVFQNRLQIRTNPIDSFIVFRHSPFSCTADGTFQS